jgi:hypothetical protein
VIPLNNADQVLGPEPQGDKAAEGC